MKRFFIFVLAVLLNLTFARASSQNEGKNIFKISKSSVSERMYQYFYCLSITTSPRDVAKASDGCSSILDKRNPVDAQGLGDQITANLDDFSKDMADLFYCLKKEGDNTSIVNDQTAVSNCEDMVMPTRGFAEI
jgi:hypothetical protein